MKKTIWIDVDHLPHVQIYHHIIEELSKEYSVLVTTKEYGQTVELLKMKGIDFTVIGTHPGKGLVHKVWGNISRALNLWRWTQGKNISLAACNGSRALILASWLGRIDSIVAFDYEHAEKFLKKRLSTYLLVPSKLGKDYLVSIGFPARKIHEYPGLKENIYLPFFKPDPTLVKRLFLSPDRVNILLRPPSDVSHYNSNVVYEIFGKLAAYLAAFPEAKVYFLPRYKSQLEKYANIIAHESVQVIEKLEDGLNLIYHMDMVVGGGGTMNREAAAMGVPVYSFFLGNKPGVDINLEKEGRLVFIENENDFGRIRMQKKPDCAALTADMSAFRYVVDFIKSKAG
jgi:predicted glycosyltransferase